MIAQDSAWFFVAVLIGTFALGMSLMWIVSEMQLSKFHKRLAAAQYQADRADHWRRLSEIESDRVSSLKTEVQSLRSKKEASDAENQRLRRRWDNGVLFTASKVVDDRFLERAMDYDSALLEIGFELQDTIAEQVKSHVVLERYGTTDLGVRFIARVMAKPFMWPNEEADHG